ncbi:MAG: Ku protein [Acidimicrobiia bacterium]|nr:Ku protein [Acidimicrobiia bacterium]
MQRRAIWTGSISFGLVNIPIRLSSAVRSHDVRFTQLDAESGSRVRMKRVVEATGEEIAHKDIKKGYEVLPGEFVLIEPDEIAALAPKASHTVEIEAFVDLSDIDPIYFEQPYYLTPTGPTDKAYRLLLTTMESQQKVAIGRIIMRTKEYLAAIRPKDGVLCLETLRFADEVLRVPAWQDEESTMPSSAEETMAVQLLDSMTVPWNPDVYGDQYRDQVLALIERKRAGETIVPAAPGDDDKGKVIDLMAALEASIAASKAANGGPNAVAPDAETTSSAVAH